MFRVVPKNNTSGYRGVSWHARLKKWIAQIRIDNRLIHLGYFPNRLEAARAFQRGMQLRLAISLKCRCCH
jgi:hypothetical protein